MSNRAMQGFPIDSNVHPAIDRRLTDLEIKASYAEDLLEELDQVIVRQQAQIDLLILEIHRLRQPVADVDGMLRPSATSDRPPHY